MHHSGASSLGISICQKTKEVTTPMGLSGTRQNFGLNQGNLASHALLTFLTLVQFD